MSTGFRDWRSGASSPPARDRLLAATGTAIVMASLGAALLVGLAVTPARRAEPIALVEVPLVTLRRVPPSRPKPHIARRAAAAAPRNLRNHAAEIVAPPPLLVPPPPIVVAPRPGLGMAPSAGASDRRGPGAGSGGTGDGAGGGRGGDGAGGDTAPRLIEGHLGFSDMPPDLRAAGSGGSVGVRYRVGIDGRVGDCVVTDPSGRAALDALTCRLITRRFRFDPSRDRDGRPVRSIVVERHSWIVERDAPAQP